MLNKTIDQNQIYIDVAKLHIDCIKTGFLPSLGIKFLALLYRSIDESNFSTLIVKYKDYQLIGFVSGTDGTSNLYKTMLYHPFNFILALFPAIFSFKNIKNIFEIFKHMSGIKRNNYPKAELLTICVHQDYRREGVAIDLYKKLLNFFKSKSITEFVIIVGQTLKANSFYTSQGAKLADVLQVHTNINSNLYTQKI
tara:strand:- start:5303 stop:5890 length:588 start_codon:yes stop_codon:yes gene_type:complete